MARLQNSHQEMREGLPKPRNLLHRESNMRQRTSVQNVNRIRQRFTNQSRLSILAVAELLHISPSIVHSFDDLASFCILTDCKTFIFSTSFRREKAWVSYLFLESTWRILRISFRNCFLWWILVPAEIKMSEYGERNELRGLVIYFYSVFRPWYGMKSRKKSDWGLLLQRRYSNKQKLPRFSNLQNN